MDKQKQQADNAEQARADVQPVGLYDMPPDQPLRTFIVLSDIRQPESVPGHSVHTEAGSLHISVARAGVTWTTRIFAPGTWTGVSGSVPTAAELTEFNRITDAFYTAKALVTRRVQEAEQREARQVLGRVGQSDAGSSRGLLNH